MNWGELGQLLTGLAACGAVVSSMRNSRKIDEVHKATNSIVVKLVETTKSEAFAAGVKSEADKGT